MATLAERLRDARKAANMTQAYVAKKICLGYSAISMIESGHRNVTCQELLQFSNLYNVSVLELLTGEKESLFQEVERKYRSLPPRSREEVMRYLDYKLWEVQKARAK